MKKETPDFKRLISQLNETGISESSAIPSRKAAISILKDIQFLMFTDFFCREDTRDFDMERIAKQLYIRINDQIGMAYAFAGVGGVDTEAISYEIMNTLPMIKEKLRKDIEALYEGDPAARCPDEVILCYPGFYAISIYRIAHEFYIRNIPYISRLMTEYAHEKTGIDIHAGATIGEYFFIDHGTGIVIGETTTIGDRVKIYQGVTLGAKSFELDANGNPVKGIKRHPDIGNNVIIYANATILGGNTKIGDGCVIGGNVWLTRSVADGEVVYYSAGDSKK
jgi:serine O-acetyltransferase